MIITRTGIPVVLVFVLSVTYSVAYPKEQYTRNFGSRVLRDTYGYNHPPAFQDETGIPVAVVYEESTIPKGKSIVNERIEYKSDKISSPENIEEEDIAVTKTPKLNPILPRRQVLPKGRAFEIPVSVVYESESRKLRSNEEVKPSTRKPVRNRLVRKKLVKSTPPTVIESATEAAVSNTVTEAKLVTQKEKPLNYKSESTRTFPKRGQGRTIVPIIESESYVFSHSGNFHYSYEGGDGTKAFEKGELRTFDDDTVGEAVSGNFSYTDKDGNDFALSYTADENGYRPVGAHLPTPPPIPPAIARALKYLATKTPDPNDYVTEAYKYY